MATKVKAYGICIYRKNQDNIIQLLLCKSISSKKKWGFLKGGSQDSESKKETAIREFFEESSIKVHPDKLEDYFEQKNAKKDIGIFLVNYDKIGHIDKYFARDKLMDKYLSWENSEVQFFNINELPMIKNNQLLISKQIVRFFKGRSDAG